MPTQIKGLSQFIADLRTTTTQEAERARVQAELASVRKKLASNKAVKDLATKTKNGYENRKIVSKLLYIYILGYDVDLGSDEICVLLQTPKFAEKQVGYLALSILLRAQHDLKNQIEPIVMSDLRSPKEAYTSLALNLVSDWGQEQDISNNLVGLVYQLMVSPTSSPAVAKKAALTFLNFYRQNPQRFYVEPEWPERVERISAIVVGPNLGVTTSAVSLLIEIAKTSPNVFDHQSFAVVLKKLGEVYDGDGAEANDYRYYQIFTPWLVAKLCQLLSEMTVMPLPSPLLSVATTLVTSILNFCAVGYDRCNSNSVASQEALGSPQRQNACRIMFNDAALLGNKLNLFENDSEITRAIFSNIKELLVAKDTNSRYFGLKILQRLNRSPRSYKGDAYADEVSKIVLNLVKDRDISVRQSALNALSSLVDRFNVESVSAELLDLLVASDLMIRPLIVARLAVIIERFATSHEWYFDTCMTLLEIGGTYAGDKVWQRLIQVVVNNEALQPYAVKRVYETLSSATESISYVGSPNPLAYSDAIVKLGGFILGEFCSQYKGDIMDLFMVLQDQIDSVPWKSRAILLSAYLKFAEKFPHIRPTVEEAISMCCESSNLETQQRAYEYMQLLRTEHSAVLSSLIEPMPPFGEDVSSQSFQKMEHSAKSASLKPLSLTTSGGQMMKSTTTGIAQKSDPPMPVSATSTDIPGRQLYLSSNWEFGFRRMLTHNKAVLYQDALLQIGCRNEFKQSHGQVILYIKNTSSYEMASLNVQIKNPMNDDILHLVAENSIVGNVLKAGKVFEYKIRCEARQPFALIPTCRITCLAGSFLETNFKLPITLEKFMSPSSITSEQFRLRWEQVGHEYEFSKHFKNFSISKAAKTTKDDVDLVRGMQYGVVPAMSTNATFGAGIIHTSIGGIFGALLMLKSDAEKNQYTATIRATRKKLVAVVLANNFAQVYQL